MPSIHNSVESSKCLELLHLQALSNHTRKAGRLGLWGEQMIQTRHGEATPPFLGHVCTYRYLVNGQFVRIAIDCAGHHDTWEDRTWEFFNADTGVHLNDTVVSHVDDGEVPSYTEVYECIVKPNYEVDE